MNALLSNLKKDPLYLTGLALLAICTALFFLPMPRQDLSFQFLFAYGAFIVYFCILLAENKRQTGRRLKFSSLPHNLLLLLLANISAYTLNVSIGIFEPSATWLCVFLVLLNVILIGAGLRVIANSDADASPAPVAAEQSSGILTQVLTFGVDVSGDQSEVEPAPEPQEPGSDQPRPELVKAFQPDAWNYFTVVVICAGMLFQAYQVIYVMPLMPFSLAVFWFFGISLLMFLPVWFFLGLWSLLRKFLAVSPMYWKSAIAGWALPMVFLGAFILQWNNVGRTIEQVHHEAIAPLAEEGLPTWAIVGQRLNEDDWMVKRILNIRRDDRWGDVFFGGFRRAQFVSEDGLRHDPIVSVASMVAHPGDLSVVQLDKMQTALSDSRHKTEPRLWSGEDLRTPDIVTNVQLFPAHRLAYTEKTLLIENTHQWSENQQEAIYSFYLPEGSVVTSASLWMGDHEEKAYLATRQKADSAYQTIVGVERKDPLLVRWQEGNRVSVRVFPCTPKEKRKFKIGITSPLRYEADELIYENIDFEGCDKDGARETVQVLTEGGEPAQFSSSLKLKNKGVARHFSGDYQPDWSLKFQAPPLSQAPFSFNGRSFQMQPLDEKLKPAPLLEIYLDINDGWEKSQFKALWRSLKNKEIYAWSGGMVRLTEENKDEVFAELNRLNYSLFPFDKIRRPAEAVVVTAGCGFAPVPGDLDTCLFARNLLAFFARQKMPVRVLNLGDEISPYFKGLAETRSLQIHAADLENVLQLLETQQFPAWQENPETVVLHRSSLKITASPTHPSSLTLHSSPDHLLRLFAYNDLMKRLGKDYFDKKSVQEALVGQAQEAYVVTPVSSLISLETEEDYKRFNIEEAGENSLQNASIKSSGAVPEPHEWVLLAVCFGAAVLLFWRRSLN